MHLKSKLSLIGRKRMQTLEAKRPWQPGSVLVLALLSLLVPLAAIFLRLEPAVPFAHPDHVSYYRQTVAALILGMACAAGALVGIRVLTRIWLRWLSVVLAILGLLIGAYLLVALIGTCGGKVLRGVCTP
jgi:hypothetical protein